MSRFAHKLFFTALSAIVIAVAPAAAQAADTDLAKPGAATGRSRTPQPARRLGAASRFPTGHGRVLAARAGDLRGLGRRLGGLGLRCRRSTAVHLRPLLRTTEAIPEVPPLSVSSAPDA